MKKISYLILLVVFSCLNIALMAQKRVDNIVFNANIYTVDSNFSKAEAMAIDEGKIVAIGKNDEILTKYSSDNKIDLNGKYVYPGFNDGHSHFLSYSLWISNYANLVGTSSFDEILEILQNHHKKNGGDWLLGRGWDQNDWDIKEFPDNSKLNDLFPNVAVVITRIDGHAVIANDFALKIAGYNANTKIKGGKLLKKNGKLTGVLIDNAADKMQSFIPIPNNETKTRALLKAQQNCFAQGLSTVSDAGMDKSDILLVKKLQDEGKLKIKVYAMLSPSKENFDYFYPQGPLHYDRLTISSVKLYSDGALGSRGALLLKPYSDDPENYGLQLHPQDYFDKMCKMAYDAGYQVNTHAIGDSGNRIMLNTYSKYLKPKNDRRWRIEHAQIVSPSDLHIFKDYSIIPSVQATHCTSDMYWADERLGEERIKTAYAYNDLKNQLGWLINGTDFPIEDISPLKTYYASVARKDAKGWPENGFQTENALSREDALRSITIWPAKGSFDENTKGSLEVGKDADFVVLNTDMMNCSESELLILKVISLYIFGEKVF